MRWCGTAWARLWPLPWTLLGLALGGLMCLSGGRVQRVLGVLEFHGGLAEHLHRVLPRAWRFDALTLGHVVLARHAQAMDSLRAHERVHVKQYERWGPLFLPAYWACSLWLWLRGRHWYRDNPFEKEAHGQVPSAPERY